MFRSILVILFSWCFSLFSWSATYAHVRDEANVLSESSRETIESLLQSVQDETTAEVLVMTVISLNGSDIDTFATDLFNQIGIGRTDTNNGVLFLIAPNEHRTRIEVGYGLESLLTDAVAGEILDHSVLPYFRNDDMEGGVVAGAKAISDLLQGHSEEAEGVADSEPVYDQGPPSILRTLLLNSRNPVLVLLATWWLARARKRYPYWQAFVAMAAILMAFVFWSMAYASIVRTVYFSDIIDLVLLIVLIYLNIRLYQRFKARNCQECGGPMRLLSEQEDDQSLDQIQRLEEKLGSVDYDVWFCPACLDQDISRHVQSSSAYGPCPKCGARTFKEKRTTIVAATTSHGGTVRVDGHCESCGHDESRKKHTARISRSSSSSGGSSGFGSSGGGSSGGSSGGGGASRGW